MEINPYLNFNGDCREAFTFYEQVLGGEIEGMITHADMPMEAQFAGPEWADKILHARLNLGNRVLMGSDSPPDWYAPPRSFSVQLSADSPEEADQLFATLSEGGSVQMPIQETPWAVRFGMLTDKFGIPWMINFDRA